MIAYISPSVGAEVEKTLLRTKSNLNQNQFYEANQNYLLKCPIIQELIQVNQNTKETRQKGEGDQPVEDQHVKIGDHL